MSLCLESGGVSYIVPLCANADCAPAPRPGPADPYSEEVAPLAGGASRPSIGAPSSTRPMRLTMPVPWVFCCGARGSTPHTWSPGGGGGSRAASTRPHAQEARPRGGCQSSGQGEPRIGGGQCPLDQEAVECGADDRGPKKSG
jgi:hypothetical protein